MLTRISLVTLAVVTMGIKGGSAAPTPPPHSVMKSPRFLPIFDNSFPGGKQVKSGDLLHDFPHFPMPFSPMLPPIFGLSGGELFNKNTLIPLYTQTNKAGATLGYYTINPFGFFANAPVADAAVAADGRSDVPLVNDETQPMLPEARSDVSLVNDESRPIFAEARSDVLLEDDEMYQIFSQSSVHPTPLVPTNANRVQAFYQPYLKHTGRQSQLPAPYFIQRNQLQGPRRTSLTSVPHFILPLTPQGRRSKQFP